MISYREPVYQGITDERKEIDFNEKNSVPRRSPLARNLKERLTNIVSLYVPDNQHYTFPSTNQKIKAKLIENGNTDGIQDHFGLLSLNDNDGADIEDNGFCKIGLLLGKNALLDAIAGSLQETEFSIDTSEQWISCMTSDNSFIYLGLRKIPYIFKVNLLSLCEGSDKNIVDSVTKINLKLNKVCELIPYCITLKQVNARTEEIYVIGQTLANSRDDSLNLLACFTLDGHLIAQTRKYLYQRYLAIDIDLDGNVLLACTTGQLSSLNGAPSAQICKLTPHFERRIFSITMKKGETFYLPQWITKTSAGERCWASVRRDEPNPNSSSDERNVTRRIFAFPGRQPSECIEGLMSPKQWLQIISWNFDAFSAGSVMALDADRLLALDTERRSLAVITWPIGKHSASIQRITKPGDRLIDHFCSNNITSNLTSTSVAFLLSDGDIFKLSLSPDYSNDS